MIRKYLSDIAIVSVFTLFAFLAADKPDTGYKKDTDVPSSAMRKYEEGETEPAAPAGVPGSYKNIATRNIFALDGSYGAGYYNPYNQQTSSGGGGGQGGGGAACGLIGILRGSENVAVFRYPDGSVVSLKTGQKLADGARIIRISQLYVKAKKGRDIKQYKIFDINRQHIGKDSY